jgi:uncharacterized damage-inducible protein DinB
MKKHDHDKRILLLLEMLDESFDHKAWHGPNLRGAIRRVDADEAAWRPGKGRKCIAEIVIHAAYWKYAARRRLRGEKRGSFAFKGSNWFVVPAQVDRDQWIKWVKLLDEEHRILRETLVGLPASKLDLVPKGGRVTAVTLLRGIAMHDVYHAGQIQTIRRLYSER